MKPAVSVIIPVYNVENYIEKCVRSLFCQTLDEVEFIFVNDCTPDNSMAVVKEVLDSFPNRAANVTFVDKPQNEGLPAARRSGLELARGEYIFHCDSDDWMEPDMLERMFSGAKANDADAVVCAWFLDDEPVPTKYNRTGENIRDQILDNMVAVGEIQSVWRYMVSRDVYSRGIEFPSFNQGEDHALMVQLVWYSKSVYCVPEPLYHWRTNMASFTRNPSTEGVERRFEGDCANARLVEDFLARQGVRERFAPQVVAHKLLCMFDLRPLLRMGEGLERWRNEFPEIKGKVLCNKHIKFAHKIEYLVDMYCPRSLIKAVYRWRSRSR